MNRTETVYVVRDVSGDPVAMHSRIDTAEGRKQITWRRPDGAHGLGGLRVADLPLYGCHELPDELTAAVVVVEGEKARDALHELGVCAVGTVTGAASCPSAEAWAVLSGRPVILWPDADEPGVRHMDTVAEAVRSVAASVHRVVPPDDAPKGWDAADADPAIVRRLLKKAVEREPTPKRADTYDPLRALRELPDEAEEIERTRAFRTVSEALASCDSLRRASLRVEIVTEAKRRGWASPTRIADEVLQAASSDATRVEESAVPQVPGMELWDPEPWPEPVATTDLLAALVALFERYLILPQGGAVALAAWTLHTWTAHDAAEFSPRVNITSPTMRCGKSHVLKVLRAVVRRPLKGDGMTAAVVFRLINTYRPTILMDEADTLGEDATEALRRVLNAGFERSGVVWRCVGEDHEPSPFSVFGPFAIARIGKLPVTVQDRGFPLSMRRKSRHESVASLRESRLWSTTEELRRRLARWATDAAPLLTGAEPMQPDALDDRAQDLWDPLFCIAELAAAEWPNQVHSACMVLSSGRNESEAGALALRDLRDLFLEQGTDRLASETVAHAFGAMEDRPWSEWGRARRPITKAGVARLFRGFRIRPQTIRLPGHRTAKGYLLSRCEDAFDRWLRPTEASPPSSPAAPSPVGNRNSVTTPDTRPTVVAPARHTCADVPAPEPSESARSGSCDGVTPSQGGESGAPSGPTLYDAFTADASDHTDGGRDDIAREDRADE